MERDKGVKQEPQDGARIAPREGREERPQRDMERGFGHDRGDGREGKR
jgi:hypothetical protein